MKAAMIAILFVTGFQAENDVKLAFLLTAVLLTVAAILSMWWPR